MPPLTLTPGTRLGPYGILSALGVGGMGEVYRATDTNLKRQVAIKVLPQAVAADAGGLFVDEQELLTGRVQRKSLQSRQRLVADIGRHTCGR